MKKIFCLALISVLFCSCGFLDFLNTYDNYIDSLEFKSGKYYVEENDSVICYLTVTPSDAFSYYDTSWSIDNEKIISYSDSTNNYCIVHGLQKGTAILTAKMGNKEAKCVVTVRGGIN